MAALGYEHLVYTDIARDGMQTGVENGAYAKMAAAFGNPVIVSGGIATAADIRALAPSPTPSRASLPVGPSTRALLPWPMASRRATAPSSCPISWKKRSVPLTIEELES